MKKIITRLFILGALIALIALLPAGAAAQQLDARQRNAETVVAVWPSFRPPRPPFSTK